MMRETIIIVLLLFFFGVILWLSGLKFRTGVLTSGLCSTLFCSVVIFFSSVLTIESCLEVLKSFSIFTSEVSFVLALSLEVAAELSSADLWQ